MNDHKQNLVRTNRKYHISEVATGSAKNFIKKETLPQVFSCEFCKISKSAFFTEDLWTTASDFYKNSSQFIVVASFYRACDYLSLDFRTASLSFWPYQARHGNTFLWSRDSKSSINSTLSFWKGQMFSNFYGEIWPVFDLTINAFYWRDL